MSDIDRPRRTQRQPLSCSRCARAKIRCSKRLPCLACIDRGQESSCHREIVSVSSRRRIRRDSTPSQVDRHSMTPETLETIVEPLVESRSTPNLEQPPTPMRHQVEAPCKVPQIPNDTIVTLEFLSHGRQNLLRKGHGASHGSPLPQIAWDPVFNLDQIRALVSLHEDTVAWMYNLLHMPTFRADVEICILSGSCEKSWAALYYALLCSTIHHADDDKIVELDITPSHALTRILYSQALQTLHEAEFMAIHTLFGVQTICMLLPVAYNLDQSDLIQVLLSTAIRIAQSLGIHRVGPDKDVNGLNAHDTSVTTYLIDREVKKRTWWYLVRQDWLQIPFQNTFIIHANQFNTPMPHNCHDDPRDMICDGRVVVQPDTVYTHASYSNHICKVAIVIWRHQSRMCTVGHPAKSLDGMQQLYDQTLWADDELKRTYKEGPVFYQDQNSCSTGLSTFTKRIGSIGLLSIAHKVHTVHRYFQLQSFRDKDFAYTQQSCLAISAKCIRDVESWPEDALKRMALKMWTVITHIITCCVNLSFASIFRNENDLLYDSLEMQRLARAGRDAIRPAGEWSSIARRGGALLDALFEIEIDFVSSSQASFNIDDIVQKVMEVDCVFEGQFSLAPTLANSYLDIHTGWSPI